MKACRQKKRATKTDGVHTDRPALLFRGIRLVPAEKSVWFRSAAHRLNSGNAPCESEQIRAKPINMFRFGKPQDSPLGDRPVSRRWAFMFMQRRVNGSRHTHGLRSELTKA